MAARTKLTPLMTSKGLFRVQSPFRLYEKKVYEVVAIREFDDLWAESIDPYEYYYKPLNISEEDYKQDVAAGAAIVSLKGEEGIQYIPDTYILSYPESGLADYNHVVLSVSLGVVPKRLNLQAVKDEISQMVSQLIGVKGVVKIHTAPVNEVLTIKEGQALEKVRKGNSVHSNTEYMKLKDEQAKRLAVQQHTNKRLLAMLGNRGS